MDVDCKRLLVCKLDVDYKKSLLFDFEVGSLKRISNTLHNELTILFFLSVEGEING